jgi:uncharacterized membrane protein YbaN (DUF454 family)
MAEAGWKLVKPILLQALGYLFLVLGVLGMFLPILQGFLFLFVGLLILARHAPWAERLLDNIRSRHPRFDQIIGQAEAKSHQWGQRAKATFRACWRAVAGWFRSWQPSTRPAKKRCSCRPDP